MKLKENNYFLVRLLCFLWTISIIPIHIVLALFGGISLALWSFPIWAMLTLFGIIIVTLVRM